MKQEYAQYLIEKTRDDYDAIADDFDRTRAYCWEGLEQFVRYAKDGDRVLDFGCGNGRLFALFHNTGITYVGADQSAQLVDRACEKYRAQVQAGIAQFVNASGDILPFPDASFDCIFSIAVLHHIPSAQKREQLLREFDRVLKPGGRLVLSVWNLWQKKYRALIMHYSLKKILGFSSLDLFDIFVPWKTNDGKTVAQRYYHCFTMGELARLITKTGFSIADRGYFGGKARQFNMYAVAIKGYNTRKNNHGRPPTTTH